MSPKGPEAKLTAQVIHLARTFGYRTAHFRPAMTKDGWRTPVAGDGKGFPDLVLIGNGRTIFIELKSDVGSLRPEQKDWRTAIVSRGGPGTEYYIWRPRDWDEIVETLRGPL